MRRAILSPRRAGSRLAAVALAGLVLLAGVGGAFAHRLKMFLTVDDGAIAGYAFFVGGGRPDGVEVVVRDAAGAEVFRGRTDDRGAFRWRPSVAADYTVTVDPGDGHRVDGTVEADRLATAIAAAPPAVPAPATPSPAALPPTGSPAAEPGPTCTVDPVAIGRLVEAQVDRAVARQLRPLLEAYDQAEGRVRFNDVMGGIGMIAGLAGAGLWAASRRRGGDPT
jgi:nickel transport protein